MQSSWILTARNHIADLYGPNIPQNDPDRLSVINELLLDYAFIYRDADQKLSKEVSLLSASTNNRSNAFSESVPYSHLFCESNLTFHPSPLLQYINKRRAHNAGLYDWLLDEQPPPLIVKGLSSDVDDGHLREGDNSSEADRDEDAGEPWE